MPMWCTTILLINYFRLVSSLFGVFFGIWWHFGGGGLLFSKFDLLNEHPARYEHTGAGRARRNGSLVYSATYLLAAAQVQSIPTCVSSASSPLPLLLSAPTNTQHLPHIYVSKQYCVVKIVHLRCVRADSKH